MLRLVSGLLTLAVSSALLMAARSTPPSAAGDTSFTLGMLRRDGVIIPFANYRNGRWSNSWPEPGVRRDIPISVTDVPKGWWRESTPAGTWTAWPIGGASRTVQVRHLVNLMAQCQNHIGLQTDYLSAEPPVPPKMQPFPKDGLATTGNVRIEPVDILDDQSPDWKQTLDIVSGAVSDGETRFMDQAAVKWTHPFGPQQRARVPLTLEVLFRSEGPKPGSLLYYFESIKRYPHKPGVPGWALAKQGCDLLTYALGWVTKEPGATPKPNVTVDMTDCNRDGLVYTMPLGLLRLEGKMYWVVQRSAWDYERYDVLEIGTPRFKTALETPGGVCQ